MSDENQPLTIINPSYGLGSETSLMIPRGDKSLPAMYIEMTEVYRTISRIKEIPRVNTATYAELVTDFQTGMIQLNRILGLIELEYDEAKEALKHFKAVALLEKVEAVLAIKKIKSSQDTREAAVITDPDVIEATKRTNSLNALSRYVAGLKESLNTAYFSAQKAADFTNKDPYLNRAAGDRHSGN